LSKKLYQLFNWLKNFIIFLNKCQQFVQLTVGGNTYQAKV